MQDYWLKRSYVLNDSSHTMYNILQLLPESKIISEAGKKNWVAQVSWKLYFLLTNALVHVFI